MPAPSGNSGATRFFRFYAATAAMAINARCVVAATAALKINLAKEFRREAMLLERIRR
jgi:hypothetical protein